MLMKILQRLKNENFYWNIGFYSLVLVGFVHFLFILLFLYFHLPQLVILNAVSLLVYLYSIFGLALKALDNKDDSRIGWLIYFELMGHGIIATYFLGLQSGFQYYIYTLVLIPFFVWTYTLPIRIARATGVIVVALIVEVWGQSHAPAIALDGGLIHFLHYMNLTLVLTAIALISYFYTVSGNTYQNILFEKSNNDPLTKLYNRRYVDGVFEYKMLADKENEAAYALLLIDVDFFKKVNDVYGHRYGDNVLVSLAGILKQHVRKTSIVSRWGGEEFLIVLDNSNQDDLLSTAERLRTAVERAVMNEEPPIQITITLGGAVSRDNETFQSTLSRADQALYRGKQAGRNQVSIA